MEFEIKQMQQEDWSQVAHIYKQGIDSGDSTFESEVPSWEEWSASHNTPCNLVLKSGERVLGWIALTPVSKRCVFSGVAELSVYIDQDYQGQGIGFQLLQRVVEVAVSHGFWTLESGVFPENIASLKLHKKCGFRTVGTRQKIGKMPGTGRWRDVVLLEYRTKDVYQ